MRRSEKVRLSETATKWHTVKYQECPRNLRTIVRTSRVQFIKECNRGSFFSLHIFLFFLFFTANVITKGETGNTLARGTRKRLRYPAIVSAYYDNNVYGKLWELSDCDRGYRNERIGRLKPARFFERVRFRCKYLCRCEWKPVLRFITFSVNVDKNLTRAVVNYKITKYTTSKFYYSGGCIYESKEFDSVWKVSFVDIGKNVL